MSRLIKYQKYCAAISLATIHFGDYVIKDKPNDSNKSVIERTTITSMGTLPNGSDINVIDNITIEKGEPLKKPTDDEVINAVHVIQNLCEISNCKDCILSKRNTQCSILSGPPCEWKILK